MFVFPLMTNMASTAETPTLPDDILYTELPQWLTTCTRAVFSMTSWRARSFATRRDREEIFEHGTLGQVQWVYNSNEARNYGRLLLLNACRQPTVDFFLWYKEKGHPIPFEIPSGTRFPVARWLITNARCIPMPETMCQMIKNEPFEHVQWMYEKMKPGSSQSLAPYFLRSALEAVDNGVFVYIFNTWGSHVNRNLLHEAVIYMSKNEPNPTITARLDAVGQMVSMNRHTITSRRQDADSMWSVAIRNDSLHTMKWLEAKNVCVRPVEFKLLVEQYAPASRLSWYRTVKKVPLDAASLFRRALARGDVALLHAAVAISKETGQARISPTIDYLKNHLTPNSKRDDIAMALLECQLLPLTTLTLECVLRSFASPSTVAAFLHAGCPVSDISMSLTLINSNLDYICVFLTHGVVYPSDIILDHAVTSRDAYKALLPLLHKQGYRMDEITCQHVVMNNYLENLKWLRNHNIPWDVRIYDNFQPTSDMWKWILTHDPPPPPNNIILVKLSQTTLYFEGDYDVGNLFQ
jgi:hypothetical protein